MERTNNQGCQMVGMLDIKGQDQCRRVYSTDGIAPTLTTSGVGGGQREVKIFDTKRLRVRKLTPKEYGILQAFPMDDWKQVVSDSQAYKQFGNAVTTTVFTAIAEEIAKSIYAAEESEEHNMEAENKTFTGMNEPEEKPTAESILAAAEAQVEADQEETTKTAIPAEETITPDTLAAGMLHFLLDSGIVASACVTDETEKMFAKHIKEELDGMTIGEAPEILRDWEAAQNAVNDMLSKYAPGGYMGKIIYPLLTPLKERLEAGERTPDLYNAIVEATR